MAMGEVVAIPPNPGSPVSLLPYVERQLANQLAFARAKAPTEVDKWEIRLRAFELEKQRFMRDPEVRQRWLRDSGIVITF